MDNNKKYVNNAEFTTYLKEIARYKLLTVEEEVDYARRAKQDDNEALDALINANLRLVVKIVNSYNVPEICLMDLIQEGNMGLITAARKFDPERGIRFSTYSSWWIKQFIFRAVALRRRTIHLPLRREMSIRYLLDISTEFIKEYAHEPSYSELANLTNISEKEISRLLDWNSIPLSLDSTINNSGDTVLDVVVCEDYKPDQQLFNKFMKKETRHSLTKLRKNEQEILIKRYALASNKKQTFKTIGKKMGISPETVRQTEIRALKKLRKNGEFLQDYLYS